MGTVNNAQIGVVGTQQYTGRTKWARAYYDFATDGGAVGAINLRGDALPSGALVLKSIIKTVTAVTSGGAATVSIGTEAATDIRAAATLATAPALNATGTLLGAVTGATDPVALTADRHIVATIATAALTAGRFSVIVEYIELASAV